MRYKLLFLSIATLISSNLIAASGHPVNRFAQAVMSDRSQPAEITTWQRVTGPYGGSVTALALSPDYLADHTTYAGLRGRGVYRTVNSGDSWQPVSPDGWSVVALAISPNYATDHTLFVVEGLWTTGYRIHRSRDEGNTWQQLSSPASYQHATGLVISPNFVSDHTLYLLGSTQTYRSTDSGDTFTPLSGWFSGRQVIALAFSSAYATDQTLFALVANEGLYQSLDGGITWVSTNLIGNYLSFAVSPNYVNDQMLLATDAEGHLFISTDGGTTWSTGGLTLGSGGQHTLLFSPTFASDRLILVASSSDPGAYRSSDGGQTWRPVGWYDPTQPYYYTDGFVGGSVQTLALAPQDSYDAIAFAGTNSGLYRSTNRGEIWYPANNGLPNLTVRTIANAPGEPTTWLAGTSYFDQMRFDTSRPGEHNGNLQLVQYGGFQWRDVSGQLDRVQKVAFSPGFVSDRTAFAATGTIGQHGFANGGVYRSMDGGRNWSRVLGPLVVHTLALSPDFVHDHTLWAAVSTYSSALGLYVSTDSGNNWTPLAPAIHAAILVPSPDYSQDRTLFAGTFTNGLQKSTDGGASWSPVLAGSVTALTVSPVYGASHTLYASVRASATGPTDLYRSTDGGQTWQLLNTGIPTEQGGQPLTISVLAFAADGSVLAGVSYGSIAGVSAVYRSTDGGINWQPLGSGLNAGNIFDLFTTSGIVLTVYAGTDTGLWQIEVQRGEPAEPGVWQSSGPQGGRIQTVAVSPNFVNDGVAFAGNWISSRGGTQTGQGILRSTDGGQTWQVSGRIAPVSPYSVSAVRAYAFSPQFATDHTLFAATWGGLLKSTDGGDNWQWQHRLYFGPPGAMATVALAPDFPTSGHLMAGSAWGRLYLSRDGGLHWTANYSITSPAVIAYSPAFAQDQTAFAGGWYLYKTTDGGTSWTEILTESVSSLVVSPQFSTDQTLFAGGNGLYISRDGGTTWISTTINVSNPYINALVVSPAYATDQALFAGTGGGLYQSSDGGTTWMPVVGYPAGLPALALAISPNWPAHPVLLVGTPQGVYRTTDGGTTWARTENRTPLATTSLALSPDSSLLLTGAADYGLYGSSDSGTTWAAMGINEGGYYYSLPDLAISPNYSHDRTIFAVWASGVSIGGAIYRTTDSGQTWQRVYGTDYVGAIAISPQYTTDRTIYAAGNRGQVLVSQDGGDTWTPVGNWPAGIYSPGMQQVALPPNYPTDGTIFAAGQPGIWRLLPGATTWEPAASIPYTLSYVTSLVVSPDYAHDRTLLAATTWYTGTGGPTHYGVLRSNDGGITWQASDTGLPDTYLRGLAFSPRYATDHTIYLTTGASGSGASPTNSGRPSLLYRSRDGGLNWTAVGAPPGNSDLREPVVKDNGDIYVATSIGVWRYQTPAQDILTNGDFEAGGGWHFPATPCTAGYSQLIAYAGTRSARIGADNGNDVRAYSSARQFITVPMNIISATLSFYVYPVSGETTSSLNHPVSNPQLPRGRLVEQSGLPLANWLASFAASDAQYALILNPDVGTVIQTLFRGKSNAQAWQRYTFDLSGYAGQRIMLHFGVYNDGTDGQTGMYVDNVSLVVTPQTAGPMEQKIYVPLVCSNCTESSLIRQSPLRSPVIP